VCLVGCLLHPDTEWDSTAGLGGVVAHIVVGPAEG
jgi:hypothetical protein